MKSRMKLPHEQTLIAVVVVLACGLMAFPTWSSAQTPTPGNNAVYYQTSGSATCCKGSGAFIDASVLVFTNSTICSVLYRILSSSSYSYPSGGAVIDGRVARDG